MQHRFVCFSSHDKSWLRKTKEVLIAMNLERKYSKDELLEVYLNRIYFGHGVYGIQAASSYYFQKDVQQLTVEEEHCSLLYRKHRMSIHHLSIKIVVKIDLI